LVTRREGAEKLELFPGSQAPAWEPLQGSSSFPGVGKLELPDRHDPAGAWSRGGRVQRSWSFPIGMTQRELGHEVDEAGGRGEDWLSQSASCFPGSQAPAWEPLQGSSSFPGVGKLELPDRHDPAGAWSRGGRVQRSWSFPIGMTQRELGHEAGGCGADWLSQSDSR